jgi:hypothetical protein
MAHAGLPVPAFYLALHGASSKLSLCPSDFHIFLKFLCCGEAVVDDRFVPISRRRDYPASQLKVKESVTNAYQYACEIKSDSSEVLVAPASCRPTAETGEAPILLMLGVDKNFFRHNNRMLTYHGNSPFSVHQQTNGSPALCSCSWGRGDYAKRLTVNSDL